MRLRSDERGHPRPARLAALLTACALIFLTAGPLPGQPPASEPGVYKGREIAGVMSYRGAPWLEREGREQEENPDALLDKMALESGQTVADLGCGSGFYSRRIAKRVGAEGKVFAVDIQPQMLDILQRLAAQEELDNIVPVLGEPDDPRLPRGEIDWILLVDVYHELQDPAAMLAELRQALAPDGRVAVVEFRLEGDSAAHIKREHRMAVDQVLAEWEPAGFELVEQWEGLPTQHVFIFKSRES